MEALGRMPMRMRTAAPVCRAFDEPTAGLHLHVQASLHAAHFHILMKVSVHVALGCGQLQLNLAYGLLVLLVSRLEEGFGLMDQVAQVFFLLGAQKG